MGFGGGLLGVVISRYGLKVRFWEKLAALPLMYLTVNLLSRLQLLDNVGR